jgi:endonuclease-3 related protein
MAVKRLRKARMLTLAKLSGASQAELESLIRPAGFYRQKAFAIRNFIDWLNVNYNGSLKRMFAVPASALREELLKRQGLGPETVDAILLYAGRQPFFVADAYTRRILSRHELLPDDAGYSGAQQYLHRNLPADQALFNEFHALLVQVGKRYCQKAAPRCDKCPLQEFLPQPHKRLVNQASATGSRFPMLHNAQP